jgi:hypothetical protein
MPNQNGSVYGLTLLSPILHDPHAVPSHSLQIRDYLATLPTGAESPFAIAPGTHLCRLVVMDDVIYVGEPACEEHLKSKYLIFETNCDADLDAYITGLAHSIPQHLDAIWGHCIGYPGTANLPQLLQYMKTCQLTTTFFFAAVNNSTVTESLRALQTQRAVADFIATRQGMDPAQIQRDFITLTKALATAATPAPGSMGPHRDIKTGGHNE